MARPRIHDEEALLDSAEDLLADGTSALTIRALATRTGAPSGTLYHAFGSRSKLLGRLWLRGARRFLSLQQEAIDAELGDGPVTRERAVAATVAASLTLQRLSDDHPATAKLLFDHRRHALLGDDLPPDLTQELDGLDAELLAQMKRLARALTGRADRRTVDVVTVCLVDLPSAVLPQRRPRTLPPGPVLTAAVRGVLDDFLAR